MDGGKGSFAGFREFVSTVEDLRETMGAATSSAIEKSIVKLDDVEF